MISATRATERLGRLKAPYEKKTKVIRVKMLPKGLYGCEMAPVHEHALRSFRSATADALAYTTKQRPIDLTFAVPSKGDDLDPEVYIAAKRVTAFRRARSKKGTGGSLIASSSTPTARRRNQARLKN